MRRTEESAVVPTACQCEACKTNRRDPTSKLRHRTVHDYSAEPAGGWKPKAHRGETVVAAPDRRDAYNRTVPRRPREPDPRERHANREGRCYGGFRATERCYLCVSWDHYDEQLRVAIVAAAVVVPQPEPLLPPTYYIGVELETQAPFRAWATRRGWKRSGTNTMAADMRRPKNHWVAKHDGSVTGPEFASQPATLAWWYAHRRDVDEMFTMLLHAGYRSHVGDKAGLHVNLSGCAFKDAAHIERFLALLSSNTQWALRMSQRTYESMHAWANVETFKDNYNRQRFARDAYEEGYNDLGRYTALNRPDFQRYEFRLPRGTLRLDRFYKNLEWAVSMVEYTRDALMDACTPPLYMASVLRGREYPDLRAFVSDRFKASIAKSAECQLALALAV